MSCIYLLPSTLTRLADGFGSKEVDPTLLNIEIHPKDWFPRFKRIQRIAIFNSILLNIISYILPFVNTFFVI